jgi:hypothetical protein
VIALLYSIEGGEMKDRWKIALVAALAFILAVGIFEAQKQKQARQKFEEQFNREWAEKEAERREIEERQRIERAKTTFSEMPSEKKHVNCQNHPDLCLVIGMREDDVIEMLGWPDKKNKSTFSVLGETHYSEQWVYELWDYEAAYVYFEDWRVTGWQR